MQAGLYKMANPWAELEPIEENAVAVESPTSNDPWAALKPISGSEEAEATKPSFLQNLSKAVFKSPEEIEEEQQLEAVEEDISTTLGRYISQIAQAPAKIIQGLSGGSARPEFGAEEGMDPYQMQLLEKKYANDPEKLQQILSSVQQAQAQPVTVENVAKFAEQKTGLPLEAKTPRQKAVGFASELFALQPGNLIKKGAAAAGTYYIKRTLQGGEGGGLKEPLTNIPFSPSFTPVRTMSEKAGQRFSQKIKDSNALRNVLSGTPTEAQAGMEATRKELGLKPLPITETSKSTPAKVAEKFIDLTGVGQEEFNTIFSNFDESFVNRLSTDIEKISASEFENSVEAGRALKKHISGKTPVPQFPTNAPGAQPQAGFHNPVPAYLATLSAQPSRSDIHGGVDLMRTVEARNRHYQDYFNNSYDILRDEAKAVPAKTLPGLIQELDTLNRDLAGSLVESAAEKTTIGVGRQLREALHKNVGIQQILADPRYQEFITPEIRQMMESMSDLEEVIGTVQVPREIPLDRLIKTQKSLNSISDFEVQGGFKQNLKSYRKLINDAINTYGEEAPEVVDNLRRLDSEFANFAENFRNDVVAPALNPKERSYESIYEKFKKPENFNVVSHILNETPEGQQLARTLQRDMFSKIIGDQLQTTESATTFRSQLSPSKVRDLQNFRTTLQPNQIEDFDNFITQSTAIRPEVAQEIVEGPLSPEQLRAQVLDSILKHDAEGLMKSLNSLENVQKVKSIMQETPTGNQLWNAVAKHKLEQKFSNLFLTPKQGRFKYNTFEQMLADKDERSWFKEMGGEDYLRNLEKLHSLSLELTQKFKGKNLEERNAWGAVGNTLFKWGMFARQFVSNPWEAVVNVSGPVAKDSAMKWLAKQLADPAFVEDLNTLAESKRQGNLKEVKSTIKDLEKKKP